MSETLKTAEPSKEACKAATRENSLYAAYAIDVAPLIAEREALKKERDEWKEQAHITRWTLQHVEMRLGRADNAFRNIGMSLGSSDEWTDQATMIADVEGRVTRLTRENAAMREALAFCREHTASCSLHLSRDDDLDHPSLRSTMATHLWQSHIKANAVLAQLTPELHPAALNALPENAVDALAEARATIAEAVEIMRTFVRQNVSAMLSLDELNFDKVDFDRASAFVEKHSGGAPANGGEARQSHGMEEGKDA